jgi:hypothetical protein
VAWQCASEGSCCLLRTGAVDRPGSFRARESPSGGSCRWGWVGCGVSEGQSQGQWPWRKTLRPLGLSEVTPGQCHTMAWCGSPYRTKLRAVGCGSWFWNSSWRGILSSLRGGGTSSVEQSMKQEFVNSGLTGQHVQPHQRPGQGVGRRKARGRDSVPGSR